MVHVAASCWDIAAEMLAVLLLEGDREALGFGVEALLPPEVEHLALAVEDGGDDPCLARQSAGFGGGDLVAG
ncbi:MAG: hypothetical protein WB767_02510, partial [Nocardioides sp.]